MIKQMLKDWLQSAPIRASVSGGALVIVIENKDMPTVWRLDLSRIHAAAFTVQTTADGFDVGIEGPKGDFSSIVSCPTKLEAKLALSAIHRALTYAPFGAKSLVLKVVAVTAAIMVSSTLLASLTTHLLDASSSTPAPIASSAALPSAAASGMPRSADEVFKTLPTQ
jgi:hypothetical protein